MIDMKDKFMCISIRQDGYEMFSNGGWASYNKDGEITGSCGDIDSFPATLSVSVAGKKEGDTNASAVFNGVLSIKDNQIFMREAFIDTAWLRSATPDSKVQSENYIPGKSGFLIDYSTGKAEFNGKIAISIEGENKTLERRVTDLKERLTEEQEIASLRDKISEAIRSSVRKLR